MTGRFFKNWLPVLLWLAVIFVASTGSGSEKHTETLVRPPVELIKPDITEPQFERIHFDVRKAAHFTEYGILGLLLLRAVRGEPRLSRLGVPVQAILTVLACSGYAASDEWHQRYVYSRTPSPRDVLIDTSGAAFGVLVLLLLVRYWPKRQRNNEMGDVDGRVPQKSA